MDSVTGNSSCPPQLDVYYDELQQTPSETPGFKEIFKELDERHGHSKNIYCLTEEAHAEFVPFHDELNKRKKGQDRQGRDRKSALSKAKEQVVRLAAVTFALHQAINTVSVEGNRKHPAWPFAIPRAFVQRAFVLMNFCID